MDIRLYDLWFHGLQIKNEIKIDILKSNVKPEEFYRMKIKDYFEYNIDIIKAEVIENSKKIDIYEKIFEYLENDGIKFIIYSDSDYPEFLRYIPNPPTGLFVKGTIPDLTNSLAVVGARRASEYGKTAAYKLSYEAASNGIVIVSGMARGIDSCAHRGALDSGGSTIAVMGSGFKHIYPPENKKLFDEIISSGCVITEYFPDTMPYQQNFPERNRIISGLSSYVLIVEAGEKSGSLITANCALEQGKDVFAVPGNIFSPNSIGTNRLIKDGAKIITGVEDIFEEYSIEVCTGKVLKLDESERRVIGCLKTGGLTIEQIVENSGMDAGLILSAISKLECCGIIKRAYGSYYIKCLT